MSKNAQAVSLPDALPMMDDLRTKPIANKRTYTFTETAGNDNQKFFINDKQFAMDRVDTTFNLGDIEE